MKIGNFYKTNREKLTQVERGQAFPATVFSFMIMYIVVITVFAIECSEVIRSGHTLGIDQVKILVDGADNLLEDKKSNFRWTRETNSR